MWVRLTPSKSWCKASKRHAAHRQAAHCLGAQFGNGGQRCGGGRHFGGARLPRCASRRSTPTAHRRHWMTCCTRGAKVCGQSAAVGTAHRVGAGERARCRCCYNGSLSARGRCGQACLARMYPDFEALTDDGRLNGWRSPCVGHWLNGRVPTSSPRCTAWPVWIATAPQGIAMTFQQHKAPLQAIDFPLWGSRLIECRHWQNVNDCRAVPALGARPRRR